ncbi:hypothetical protein [Lactiplantibacillus plantarum]|uniref:hypothetical protein n=1 Tax=Lactiplantibacillus plantarum TaxID=1590 RepID=UPI0016517CF3|nr:hypothetical protein [Lactiplantibacillus plantarum]
MKIKTFWTSCTEDEDFDKKVNSFIKDKNVTQISTGDTMLPFNDHVHTLTVLYTEADK